MDPEGAHWAPVLLIKLLATVGFGWRSSHDIQLCTHWAVHWALEDSSKPIFTQIILAEFSGSDLKTKQPQNVMNWRRGLVKRKMEGKINGYNNHNACYTCTELSKNKLNESPKNINYVFLSQSLSLINVSFLSFCLEHSAVRVKLTHSCLFWLVGIWLYPSHIYFLNSFYQACFLATSFSANFCWSHQIVFCYFFLYWFQQNTC